MVVSTRPTKPLAVTMGEPAGIGPDILLRLHSQRATLKLPPFVVYGNSEFLSARAQRLGLQLTLHIVGGGEFEDAPEDRLLVRHVDGMVPDKPGQPTLLSGKVVIEAITAAVHDTLSGECRGLVTAPIHKAVLYAAGFTYPGHTEFLAALCGSNSGAPKAVMMLAHEALRVVPATIHVPLADVPTLITFDTLVDTGRIVAHDLRTRYGLAKPRLAFAGLNPHAGEGGAIGLEELQIILPAVEQLKLDGIDATGPIPADTLFYLPHWQQYDAVIAMYHDQALIPIKTVAFDEAVNVTLGLPIVRTSPDHGTAFDLAGTGSGSVKSFLAAIRLADQLTQ